MSNNKNVPQIRFIGFTDAWEQRKLGEVVERVTRKNQDMVSTLPLTISAQYGLIDQNEFFDKRVASKDVSGYYLIYNGEFAYNKSTSNDAPWGAIKRLDKYKNGVLSTLYIIFKIPDETTISSDFLVSYYNTGLWHKGIQAIAAEGARNHGLLNIAPADFFETELLLPQDIDEQKAIGEYFTNLDNLITLHQRKCDTLSKLKKSMLQKMFPKNGGSVPEFRFEGFTDAWEQRQLGELIKDNQKPVPKPNEEYTRLGIRSHAKGTFHEIVEAGGGLDVDTMYVVESDNLIVNITFAWEEAWAITTNEDAGKLVSHRFPQYKFNNNQYPIFYKYRFSNKRIKYNLELASPGGAGRNRVLNKSEFLKIPLIVPTSYAEQTQIGTYFQNLDNLITLHQRKLETLKKLKKSMLQKMFV